MPDFDALVEAHYEGLYRFAMSLARNSTDAVDLTQQTFYRFALKGHQIRDPTMVKSWLLTTMRREFYNHCRKTKNFRRIEEEVARRSETEQKSAPTPLAHLDAREAMEALGSLEEKFRLPLALFYIQGFSYKQIAESLEVPVGTVMSRLSRGKAALKRMLTDPDPEPPSSSSFTPIPQSP